MKIVIIGLSITSSWGNGHATTYRALLKELSSQGHDLFFLERDVPYYAANRDMPSPPFCRVGLYSSNLELKKKYEGEVAGADVVIVGSYVVEGADVGEWVLATAKGVTAFYDIDTPVTLAKLQRGDHAYLHPDQIAKYNLYLSFSGGPILTFLEGHYGSPNAKALYCSVDLDLYHPEPRQHKWQMAYLGTYSEDRQPTVHELLNKPAAQFPSYRFMVAGPQYPYDLNWSKNVERLDHLPPSRHREFYNSQKFALNVTREDMINAGHSPSVRLFEAAACGVPIISDYWEGIEDIFEPNTEILIAHSCLDVKNYFNTIDGAARLQIGEKARLKVMARHSATARAKELEAYVKEVLEPSKT